MIPLRRWYQAPIERNAPEDEEYRAEVLHGLVASCPIMNHPMMARRLADGRDVCMNPITIEGTAIVQFLVLNRKTGELFSFWMNAASIPKTIRIPLEGER